MQGIYLKQSEEGPQETMGNPWVPLAPGSQSPNKVAQGQYLSQSSHAHGLNIIVDGDCWDCTDPTQDGYSPVGGRVPSSSRGAMGLQPDGRYPNWIGPRSCSHPGC